MGNIIIMAATFEEHLRLSRKVFNLLRNASLTVKLEKCKFLKKEIKHLGAKLMQDGIKTDSENCKQLAAFLGMFACFFLSLSIMFLKYVNLCLH